MAKKKGKGKKKKKGKQKKMSNLERETFRLLIEDLENKISWRKEMCQVIEEDIHLYQKAYEEEREDKKNAVSQLEIAIQDQNLMTEKIKNIIPDAEKLKAQTEKTRSWELAEALKLVNEEKLSNAEQLQAAQTKLMVLEKYDTHKVRQKISEVESQLNSCDKDEVLRASEIKQLQENALKKELAQIFENKSLAHQEDLKGKLDSNIERIAEETRWWKDSENILRSMRKRLEESNTSKATILTKDEKDLQTRKKFTLEASVNLQEQKKKIWVLEKRNEELLKEKLEETRLQEEKKRLAFFREIAKENLEELRDKFEDAIDLLQNNENHIKELEEEIALADEYGDYLVEVLETAKNIIADEVKYSLIKTYDGPPEKKNVLLELESLFDEATERIYEHINSKTEPEISNKENK